MTKPDLEDGYLKLANELAEALARTYLTPSQSKCIWFLMRMTYGWNRKSASITSRQWTAGTGLDKSCVYRTLRQLTNRKIVVKVDHQWSINKQYTQWREVVKFAHSTGLHTRSGHVRPPNGGQGCTPLPIKTKNNLKKGEVGKVAHQRYEPPTGRVQPKGHHTPPCKECGFQYAVGYEGMDKNNVCLDCRQEVKKE